MSNDVTYHTGTRYRLPRGATEDVRLDEQSAGLIAMLGDEPFKAPLPRPPKKILDVGCGTGVMTLMLGSMFPDAKVFGVDLAELPSLDTQQDNVTFINGDVRELMSSDTSYTDIFEAGSFDYIYSRTIVFGMVDWPSYLREVYQILAPGGIYEIQEHSQKYFDSKDKVMSFEVTKEINKYLSDTGHDPLAGHHASDNLQSAGFHVLHEQYFRWPLSRNPEWPESVKLGTFMWNFMPDFMPKVVTGLLGPRLGEKRAKEVIDSWFNDRESGRMGPGVHSKFTVAVGQKPQVQK